MRWSSVWQPLVCALVMVSASPVRCEELTIEQAYATIHPQRAVFDPGLAGMAPEESAYLAAFFDLIDLAVKERVETLLWLQSKGTQGEGIDEYDALLARFAALRAPGRLRRIHQWVITAVTQQRDVLREWRADPTRLSMRHPLVGSSSSLLHQTYGEVIRLYPGEDQRNRQAFYDYFCSLDFL